jgi:hypothetical protein
MDETRGEGRGVSSPHDNAEFQNSVRFRKSIRSFSEANCVEVSMGQEIRVRDSKAVAVGGPHLTFSVAAWGSFIKSVKDGRITS